MDWNIFIIPSLNDFLLFFFFQAEDGIRDKLVTGVQTCALPILTNAAALATLYAVMQNPESQYINLHTTVYPGGAIRGQLRSTDMMRFPVRMLTSNRSEERREGKSVDLGGRRMMKKKKNTVAIDG